MKWYILGNRTYQFYSSAFIKHLEMRDAGFKTRVTSRHSHGTEWFIVQIWE